MKFLNMVPTLDKKNKVLIQIIKSLVFGMSFVVVFDHFEEISPALVERKNVLNDPGNRNRNNTSSRVNTGKLFPCIIYT